ncbi:hypothetical protein AGR6A_Cc60403 [Agrobacterium sp. NCPPB 925]|nr:hypothetical protein AGR6A_Cc60403 [Agrobacterium sp. NCPPB 925]
MMLDELVGFGSQQPYISKLPNESYNQKAISML